jgi:hypothetical protein
MQFGVEQARLWDAAKQRATRSKELLRFNQTFQLETTAMRSQLPGVYGHFAMGWAVAARRKAAGICRRHPPKEGGG